MAVALAESALNHKISELADKLKEGLHDSIQLQSPGVSSTGVDTGARDGAACPEVDGYSVCL